MGFTKILKLGVNTLFGKFFKKKASKLIGKALKKAPVSNQGIFTGANKAKANSLFLCEVKRSTDIGAPIEKKDLFRGFIEKIPEAVDDEIMLIK